MFPNRDERSCSTDCSCLVKSLPQYVTHHRGLAAPTNKVKLYIWFFCCRHSRKSYVEISRNQQQCFTMLLSPCKDWAEDITGCILPGLISTLLIETVWCFRCTSSALPCCLPRLCSCSHVSMSRVKIKVKWNKDFTACFWAEVTLYSLLDISTVNCGLCKKRGGDAGFIAVSFNLTSECQTVSCVPCVAAYVCFPGWLRAGLACGLAR